MRNILKATKIGGLWPNRSNQVSIGQYVDQHITYWPDCLIPTVHQGSWCHEFLIFGLKMAWSAIYGACLLLLIILTFYFDFTVIARYDVLFLGAILIQVFLIYSGLEEVKETRVILAFHVVATVMELFKTHPDIGSWAYPEACFFKIGNVPLFTGFMYSAVGSFIARSWRLMHLQLDNYPGYRVTVLLASAIYLNFFTHHFTYDYRYLLFGLIAILFLRTNVHFLVYTKARKMPLLLAFGLISFFLWIAENAGTYGNIWRYPNQMEEWQLVSFHKMGAWYLLVIVSFVLVSLHRKSTVFRQQLTAQIINRIYRPFLRV